MEVASFNIYTNSVRNHINAIGEFKKRLGQNCDFILLYFKVKTYSILLSYKSFAVFYLHCLLFAIFIESDPPNRPQTPCERQREAALQGSADAFAPSCRRDGSFDPVQCKGLMCYCVDNNGKPIKGTDTPRPYQPNCYGT